MNNIFNYDNVNISDEILKWEDAIILSAKPLMDSGYIGKDYLDAIFKNIDKFGPYFDFGFGVAVPHARPEFGVKNTGVSLLKLNHKVNLINSFAHPIELIVTFCSVDYTSHINILKEISSIFGDREKLNKIKRAMTKDKILEIINN